MEKMKSYNILSSSSSQESPIQTPRQLLSSSSRQLSSSSSSQQLSPIQGSEKLINYNVKRCNNNLIFLMTIIRKYKNKKLSEIDKFVEKTLKEILENSCPDFNN
jgi:hypothetical protein